MTDLYEPAQLRTFLAVAQTRSFTQAATRLGLRQPTVSSHIRKLEQATGRQLLARDTHSVSLTPDGEAMIGFAGAILASYAPAQRYFTGPQPRGRVRLGLSDDLALTRLPEILRAFRGEHPLIDLELTVDQSGQLHRRLERNQLDLFLGKRPLDDGPSPVLVRRDPLVWIGTPGAHCRWWSTPRPASAARSCSAPSSGRAVPTGRRACAAGSTAWWPPSRPGSASPQSLPAWSRRR